MKKKVTFSLLGIVVTLIVLSVVYTMGQNSNKKQDTYIKAKSSKKQVTENLTDTFQEFAKKGHSVDEMYVTGDIKVNKNSELKPGIYDMEVTGGSGNIGAYRSQINAPFINYLGDSKGSSDNQGNSNSQGPSKIRLILFSDDVLKLRNISKVKFTAVSTFRTSNQLGQGEYVVGLDIPAGTYKLSTNVKFNPEFENLGWSVDILGKNEETKSQSYNSSTNDVVVKLNDGDIISTNNNYSGQTPGIKPDDEKLTFNKVK
ncbi:MULTISPECIES: hypothetical protein [Leuconostoc gelidum group]